MVNLFNLKWLADCQKTLRKLADDPEFASQIVNILDEDSELRNELSTIYTRALKTIEESEAKKALD